MAKEVTKSKNFKRSREDDKQPISAKRKTMHDLQEYGDKQIDSSLKNTARTEFIQNMLELITAVVKKRRMPRHVNIGYHAATHLEEKISGGTLLKKSRCRFCADTPSCLLQPHNIISKESPVESNSEKVNEEEKNERKASKKARRKR